MADDAGLLYGAKEQSTAYLLIAASNFQLEVLRCYVDNEH